MVHNFGARQQERHREEQAGVTLLRASSGSARGYHTTMNEKAPARLAGKTGWLPRQ